MRTRYRLVLMCLFVGGIMIVQPAAANGAEASRVIPFAVVEAGRTSEIREPTQVVIRDGAAWTALWRRHTGSAAPPAPAIDFSREMVIALFAGRSTTARALAISKIVQEPDGLVVWYVLRDTGPSPDGESRTPAAPFQIVRVTRLAAPVRFFRVKTPPVVPQP